MMELVGYSSLAMLLNTMAALCSVTLSLAAFWLFVRLMRPRLDVFIELHKDNRAVAIVAASVIIAVALAASSAFGGTRATHRYDHEFRRYGRRFFGAAVDWRWFRAQGIAESGLDPLALSPAGAVGVMQIMPATGREQFARTKTGYRRPFSLLDPEINIMLGIGYDRRLWAMWPRWPGRHRLRIMFAAYNAGPGNINRACRLAPCTGRWGCLLPALGAVTSRHARETVRYVRRIEQIKAANGPAAAARKTVRGLAMETEDEPGGKQI